LEKRTEALDHVSYRLVSLETVECLCDTLLRYLASQSLAMCRLGDGWQLIALEDSDSKDRQMREKDSNQEN
jgi:hypothetical protein